MSTGRIGRGMGRIGEGMGRIGGVGRIGEGVGRIGGRIRRVVSRIGPDIPPALMRPVVITD